MKELQLHLAKTLSDTESVTGRTSSGVSGHESQIHRAEASLVDGVVDFLAEAVKVGHPIVVIAGEARRRAIAAGLRARGLDPDEPFTGRIAIWLDVRDTLDAFMEGPRPNRELFNATVGSVFERVLDTRQYLVARAYGEMVDVLIRDGNAEGARMVEALWNDLAASYSDSRAGTRDSRVGTRDSGLVTRESAIEVRCASLEAAEG